jgi:hypothetical protein
MALARLPYRLHELIRSHLSTAEDPATKILIDELSAARKRGYLTRPELIKVCYWKSARAIRHIRRNRADSTVRITRGAFKTRSEEKKLSLLMSLHGVGVPMASAILTLTNPSRYGVIDIRVWQLLFEIGSVASKPNGAGFGFREWDQFLKIIRHFAGKYAVDARDIERTLFDLHLRYQKGVL